MEALGQGTTEIAQGSAVRNGWVVGRDLITIRGGVEGIVQSDGMVRICAGGFVRGEIKAAVIEVEGNVEGSMEATDRIELRTGAYAQGVILAPRIIVQDGVACDATFRIVHQDPFPPVELPEPIEGQGPSHAPTLTTEWLVETDPSTVHLSRWLSSPRVFKIREHLTSPTHGLSDAPLNAEEKDVPSSVISPTPPDSDASTLSIDTQHPEDEQSTEEKQEVQSPVPPKVPTAKAPKMRRIKLKENQKAPEAPSSPENPGAESESPRPNDGIDRFW